MDEDLLIRIYVIADDYRWHFVAFDLMDYAQMLGQYMELMQDSKEGQKYTIFSTDLPQGEIDIMLKNMKLYNSSLKPKAKTKAELTIV